MTDRSFTLLPDTGEPGFGIYVHWPFCAAKCPYCDFNSHVRENVEMDIWNDRHQSIYSFDIHWILVVAWFSIHYC